ncbi:AraC-like DNA-binding protein [Catenuloplanes nepalensis]|uniref:AraC-like DNA-binding protein n=1 Tax=Catenuloplanes nepalensis TaxID=587533 RepID=A0ABT9N1B9_9ACTN|nr:AraC family transcriptional regulator [Catenuloplanes nepalensis]MDP9797498.1 AraC-like DNA-binding protein [Catenuloplanes nepalensis]
MRADTLGDHLLPAAGTVLRDPGPLFATRSGSTAEIQQLADEIFSAPRWVTTLGGAPARCRLRILRFGPVIMSDWESDEAVQVTAPDLDDYNIGLAPAGRLFTEQRGIVTTATTLEGAVYRPGSPARAWWRPDTHPVTVALAPGALEAELEALLGHPIRGPLQLSRRFDLTRGMGRSWGALAGLVHAELCAADGMIYRPMIAERLWHSMLGGLLLAVHHQYSDELNEPAAPSRPRAVKRAIDAMEADPSHPFSTATLAHVAGVSARSLQDGFRRHVGVTPMIYLQDLRLGRAHVELSTSAPGAITVSEVAHRWGFVHLGRFAAAYRRRFGLLPSEALREL